MEGLDEAVAYVAPAQTDMETDVAGVGGGLAGLMPAAACAQQGLRVTLVEKNGFLGGSWLVSERIVSQIPGMVDLTRASEYIDSYGGIEWGTDSPHADMDTWTMLNLDEGRSVAASLVDHMADFAKSNGTVILTDTRCTGLVTDLPIR